MFDLNAANIIDKITIIYFINDNGRNMFNDRS